MLDGLAEQLTQVPLFAGVAAAISGACSSRSPCVSSCPDEELCREGEFHERLYVVLSGSLEQTSHAARGRRAHPGARPGIVLRRDGGHGRSARALHRDARSSTSVVLEMPKAAVHRLMQHVAAVRGHDGRALSAARALGPMRAARRCSAGVPEQAIARALRRRRAADARRPAQYVFREGDAPDATSTWFAAGFLRVERGTVSATPSACSSTSAKAISSA